LLAVIDVSGSMAEPVPSAGGAQRIDLVKKAAGNGLALYGDRAEIGLWTFSTDLTPTTDYRELVPIGPLGDRPGGPSGREALARSLAGVAPMRGGSTGLYDTVLAAVRTVRAGWEPGRVNSVVVLTDGENQDPSGIGLGQLLTTLKAEADPARPVLVIGIAYGPDSDQGALVAISAVTGGTAYTAENPADVQRVFLDAIGRRSCRPEC
jgi:Mg-chelatase subunit ChlD